jgi:alcohol dehydrogenase class IV
MTAPVDSSAAETVFTYGSPQLRFGQGAADEIGYDLARLGVRRALVITDPGLEATGLPQRVADQMAGYAIEAAVFAGTRVEPTDESFLAAIEFARGTGPWDAYVAVGGGSSIDTAKAVDLMTTNPGELLDYVNPPVGQGRAPVETLLPLIAVPTTTGTGAESTTVCVLDVVARRVKTGISHPALRPMLAVIDPDLTISQPAGVTRTRGWTSAAMRWRATRPGPSTTTRASAPSSGCRTAAPTRSPTCGQSGHWHCWRRRSVARCTTARTGRPGPT